MARFTDLDWSDETIPEEPYDFGVFVPTNLGCYYGKMNEPILSGFYAGDIVQHPKTTPAIENDMEMRLEETLSQEDYRVGVEIIKSIDPQLLMLARTLCVGEKIFDFGDPKNQFRREVVRSIKTNAVIPKFAYGVVHISECGKGIYNLHDPSGDKLAVGDFGTLLAYVSQCHPYSLKRFVSIAKDIGIHIDGDLESTLKNSRALRSVSKSLDAMSKISQLDYAEVDNPIFRYKGVEVDDPLIYNEPPYMSLRYPDGRNIDKDQLINTKCTGKTILANVTRGDNEGARTNDEQLFKALRELAELNTVQITMAMKDDLDGFNVHRISKGRPHNAVITVELSEDGQSVQELVKAEKKRAVRANVSRNSRFLGREFDVRMLGNMFPEQIDQLMGNYLKGARFASQPFVKSKVVVNKRVLALRKLSADPNFAFDANLPHVRLFKFKAVSKILRHNDFSYLVPEVSLRSVGIAFRIQGYDLQYRAGTWMAVKLNK